MGNYLTNFKEKANFEAIEDLIPSNICPFLFYNLTPYIYTLVKGGWFDWVKKSRDPAYRKIINSNDFHRKDVNRLYANEVLVRCPNPYTTIVAGVGLWPDKKIKIRILHVNGQCPNNHNLNDEVVSDIGNVERKTVDYNKLFPEILSSAVSRQSYNECIAYYLIERKLTIETSRIIFPCRYHKKGRTFKDSFLPEGFCPHIFGLIYPQILAVMYNAHHVDRKIKIKHPGKEAYINLILEKINLVPNYYLRLILSFSKKIFEAIFHPVDIMDYNLVINVIENEAADCSLKKGRKYHVNLRDDNFLCPASFHVLYPFLLLLSLGHKINWDSSEEDTLVPCPDCIGTVYSIK